jgi:membrane protein DedA with SNARE-associated domain
MSLLGAFHGALATAVLCLLLFTEETGVPLPLAPGDLVLIAAGILIASHRLSPCAFVPAAIVSPTLGGLVGYSWARLLGWRGRGRRCAHRRARPRRCSQAVTR